MDNNKGEYISETLPPIYFYIPEDHVADRLPDCAADYWPWRMDMSKKYPFLGKFDWTLQTFLRLKDDKFPCEIITRPPDHGIVVAHKDFMDYIPRPNLTTLLVCLKSDRVLHPYAQIYVVQNPKDTVRKMKCEVVKSYFMPHWVQPLMVSRDEKRAQKFENAAYFGADLELAEEFKRQSWTNTLKSLGFNWIMATTSDRWADYSTVDVLVALRRCHSRGDEFNYKPATKLYNAWHVGIPAILGVESAYRSERKSDLDYVEANSPEEVIASLKLLRDDYTLRTSMVAHGKVRAEETKSEVLVKKWEDFLIDVVVPAYNTWCTSPGIRRGHFFMCFMRQWTARLKGRITRKSSL